MMTCAQWSKVARIAASREFIYALIVFLRLSTDDDVCTVVKGRADRSFGLNVALVGRYYVLLKFPHLLTP